MIKKLTLADLEDIKNIIPSSKIHEFKETYLSKLVTWYAFGFYDNNKLKGISCVYFAGTEPEWSLLTQYCDDHNDLIKMVDEVCEKLEKHGLFKFTWIDFDYSLDYLENFIPDRYFSFKEYETAAWAKTRYSKHHGTLYQSDSHPVKTSVYLSILKSKNRNFE